MRNILLTTISIFTLSMGASFAAVAETSAGTSGPSFKQLDKNTDGYISSEEAKGRESLVAEFSRADRNQDGKVSETEFSAFDTDQVSNGTQVDSGSAPQGKAGRPGEEISPEKK